MDALQSFRDSDRVPQSESSQGLPSLVIQDVALSIIAA
jgi:hypothetical protein